jgi:hypothetical protein
MAPGVVGVRRSSAEAGHRRTRRCRGFAWIDARTGFPPALIRDYEYGGVFAVPGIRTMAGIGNRRHLLPRAHPSGEWIEWLSP